MEKRKTPEKKPQKVADPLANYEWPTRNAEWSRWCDALSDNANELQELISLATANRINYFLSEDKKLLAPKIVHKLLALDKLRRQFLRVEDNANG